MQELCNHDVVAGACNHAVVVSGAPSDSVALSGELEQCGVEFVDVAVSGGPKGAANGVLTAMVGGSAAGVERVASNP